MKAVTVYIGHFDLHFEINKKYPLLSKGNIVVTRCHAYLPKDAERASRECMETFPESLSAGNGSFLRRKFIFCQVGICIINQKSIQLIDYLTVLFLSFTVISAIDVVIEVLFTVIIKICMKNDTVFYSKVSVYPLITVTSLGYSTLFSKLSAGIYVDDDKKSCAVSLRLAMWLLVTN